MNHQVEKEEAASEAELQAADIAEHAKMMAELEDKAKEKAKERNQKIEQAKKDQETSIVNFFSSRR